MGLMETLISAPSLRQSPRRSDLDGAYRTCEPDLSFPWPGHDSASHELPEPAEKFLVANQNGVSPRGEPLFSRPFRSGNDDLALSEDGYLINGQGQFVLGATLDADGRRINDRPEILRLTAEGLSPSPTDWVTYRANLPSFPLTANAAFEHCDSELLDKSQFARDPSAQGSGIVLGDDRVKFLARSIAGGSVSVFAKEGAKVAFVLRWAKLGSLRTAGRDWWNLFYRVRRDPRGGEVAWKNCSHAFLFEADGRLEMTAHSIPIFDVVVDGFRLGNLSFTFGSGGITQFADRTGLVKVLETSANGSAGGAFTGISMSAQGRLFAHYANEFTQPVADVHFAEEENWSELAGLAEGSELARRVA